ncbi:MAG: lipase/esterase [Lacunisphaera sp.]|nr:lipase/esterase [Lacunisphaera sp.]
MKIPRAFRLLLALSLPGGAVLRAVNAPTNLDQDGDGKISRAEFTGRPEAFAKLDLNHDGFIDAQEGKGGANSPKSERAPRTVAEVPADIQMEGDIVYKTVANEKLMLDLYRVKGRKYDKAPLVIWIHGGGYVKGSKAGAVKGNAEVLVPLLMKHGYLVASLEYRLCSLNGAKITDCYADCMDAIRYLVQHRADYGIDPARMITIGSSAGGGLALMMAFAGDAGLPGDPALAGIPFRIHAAVSWFGVTDFNKTHKDFSQGDEKTMVLFDASPEIAARQANQVSPALYLPRHTEKFPILLVHGEKDPVVPFGQSVWMKAEADRLGWPVEFMPIQNMRHGFQPAGGGPITPPLAAIWRRTVEFILTNNQ